MIFNKRQKIASVERFVVDGEIGATQFHSARTDAIAANVPLSKMPFPVLDVAFGDVAFGGVQKNDVATTNVATTNGATSGETKASNVAPNAEVVAMRTLEIIEKMSTEIAVLRDETRQLRQSLKELSAQQSVQQSIFDALHVELSDYKNDFIGARMKPVITAMLFLGDTLTEFQKEVDNLVDPPDWLGSQVLSKKLVDSNLVHFKDQLDETMRMCEMEKIDVVAGEVADARTQRFISAEPTEDAALDNRIRKVVRLGWKQGSKTFRPTEVTVWKVKP